MEILVTVVLGSAFPSRMRIEEKEEVEHGEVVNYDTNESIVFYACMVYCTLAHVLY